MTLETQYKNFKLAHPENTWTFDEWKEDLGNGIKKGLENLAKKMNEEKGVVCPKCGEEENFHFNYDYGKPNLPIEDVLCNVCGEFFEFKQEK